MSRLITFEKLNNTRDLGGMKTFDGRKIKPGKLIRSGQLFFSNEEDKSILSDLIEEIVDLRTDQEIFEKPDPYLKKVRYHHLPILNSWTAGITWETKPDFTEEEFFAELRKGPELAKEYMCGIYRGFVSNRQYIAQYKKFTNMLFDDRKKALLWHCTAGKDRAGFAAILIEEILDVPRDVIIEDYMKTNVYLREEIASITDMVRKEVRDPSQVSDTSMKYLFGAEKDFIDSLYKEVELMYGSFEVFIKDGLGLSKSDVENLRQMYLE